MDSPVLELGPFQVPPALPWNQNSNHRKLNLVTKTWLPAWKATVRVSSPFVLYFADFTPTPFFCRCHAVAAPSEQDLGGVLGSVSVKNSDLKQTQVTAAFVKASTILMHERICCTCFRGVGTVVIEVVEVMTTVGVEDHGN